MITEISGLIATLTTTVVSFSTIYLKIMQHRKKDKVIFQQFKEHIDKDTSKGKLPVTLRATAMRILNDKLITDPDLTKIIVHAVTLISASAERVIMADFSDESLQLLKSDLANDASLVKNNASMYQLGFVDVNQYNTFIEKVKKRALRPGIEIYLFKLNGIKDEKNGTRLQSFETITKYFVQNLLQKIMNILNDQKNG